jgi:small subunit ribosomal protein S2
MLKGQKVKAGEAGASSIVEEMFMAGVHYGYGKSRRHPSVSPYIYATKNKGDIINLEKTVSQLEAAKEFVKGLGAKGKTVLLVGTKPEAKVLIKDSAESIGMPYVTERWIGGTLSNFSEIKRRIAELENYRKDSKEGGLEKYTKKERLMMAKKMEKLARYYEGLLSLKKLPDAIFIVDAREEHIALSEAQATDVPVVALVNSDSNVRGINHPIVGNDASIPSIKLFITSIAAAYKEGQMSSPAKPQA